MACSKLETKGLVGKEEEPDRSCAFCLLPVSASEVRKCGRCHRRAYCSRECQVADWKGWSAGGGPVDSGKAKGVGQGHKKWCGLAVGEEGLDWAVKEIPGKGRGLVALRNLPSLYRINVEGIQLLRQNGLRDHPGFKSLSGPPDVDPADFDQKFFYNALSTTMDEKARIGFRLSLTNHACDANAFQFVDDGLHVVYLIAARQISPYEEITVQYRPFNEVSSSVVPVMDPAKRAAYLLKHTIVCPPSCICQDLGLRSKLEEMSALSMTYFDLVGQETLKAEAAALKNMEKVLDLAKGVKLPPNVMANLHYAVFEACALRLETWAQGKPHFEKMLEYSNATLHPDSSHRFEKSPFGMIFGAVYAGDPVAQAMVLLTITKSKKVLSRLRY